MRKSSDQRREELIEAAVRVIGREGPARATTRRITEEANAPLASLHYIFRDKEELFLAVIQHTQGRAIGAYRERVSPGMGLEEATQALIELHYDWTRDDPGFMIAQYEMAFWAVRNPATRKYAPLTVTGYFESFSEILTEALAEDDDPYDVERLARYVTAAIDGMILQMIALGEEGPERGAIPAVTRGVLEAARSALPAKS